MRGPPSPIRMTPPSTHWMRYAIRLAVIGWTVALCACRPAPLSRARHSTGPPPPKTSPSASAAVSTTPSTNDLRQLNPTPSAESVAALPPPREAVAAAPSAAPVDRLLVMGSDRPLLIDVRLTFDGIAHSTVAEQTLQQLLTVADDDHNGTLYWPELCASPQFKFGQYGNQPTTVADRKSTEYRCDLNRNGIVEADELLLYCLPERQSAQRLSINERPTGGSTDALFNWFDVNADTILDEQEITHCDDRWRLLDRDDDGRLRLSELPGVTGLSNARPERADRSGGAARSVWWLRREMNPANVIFDLEQRYAWSTLAPPDDRAPQANWFARVDRNQNGALDTDEYQQWSQSAPDGVIECDFSRPASLPAAGEPPADPERRASTDATVPLPTAAVVTSPPTDSSNAATTPHVRIGHSMAWQRVNWPGVAFDIRQVDVLPSATGTVADFPAWSMWDRDGNGRLSVDEYAILAPEASVPFEAVDENQDGEITPSELTADLFKRQWVARTCVELNVAHDTAPLWSALDADHNGELSERELVQSRQVIAAMMQHGQLRRDDLTQSLRLEWTRLAPRSGLQQLPLTDELATAAGPLASADPAFRALDRNDDGEISRREFLGPTDVFDRLDANRDEFLQRNEFVPSTAPSP